LKVKELIKALMNCDPEKEVIIEYDLGFGKADCDLVVEKETVVISEKV
jgi:hypothetical protein